MSGTLKRWQTKIELDYPSNIHASKRITTYLYSDTIEHLRLEVRAYLRKNNPPSFSNGGDHITGKLIYFYHDERGPFPIFFTKDSQHLLSEGWWCKKVEVGNDEPDLSYHEEKSRKFFDFDNAILHFLDHALIPEKGPDYQSKAIIGGNLKLPFIEKILRETADNPINDLIKRGWHILALEYKGEVSMTGELMNRKAIFVLGHPEGKVASLTLNTEYIKNAQDRIE